MLEFIQSYDWGEFPVSLHEKALKHLREYVIVGGLPSVLSHFIAQGSLLEVAQMHHDLFTTYRDDFLRYKGKFDVELLEDFFDYIPRHVGKKIVFKHINQTAQHPSVKKIFTLLSKARIIHKVCACAGNGIPLGAEKNEKYLKALFLDVGLMNHMLGFTIQDFRQIEHIALVHQGAIAEQLVGQLLRTTIPYYTEPKLFYWQRNQPNSSAAIDYLIEHGSQILPIEVKSGRTRRLQSLHWFMSVKERDKALRLNTNLPEKAQIQTKLSNGMCVAYILYSLPLYFVGQINRLVG